MTDVNNVRSPDSAILGKLIS